MSIMNVRSMTIKDCKSFLGEASFSEIFRNLLVIYDMEEELETGMISHFLAASSPASLFGKLKEITECV